MIMIFFTMASLLICHYDYDHWLWLWSFHYFLFIPQTQLNPWGKHMIKVESAVEGKDKCGVDTVDAHAMGSDKPGATASSTNGHAAHPVIPHNRAVAADKSGDKSGGATGGGANSAIGAIGGGASTASAKSGAATGATGTSGPITSSGIGSNACQAETIQILKISRKELSKLTLLYIW
jgi:hypothetical protein